MQKFQGYIMPPDGTPRLVGVNQSKIVSGSAPVFVVYLNDYQCAI